MRVEIIRSTAEWKSAILQLADRCFWDSVKPEGFAGLLPELYGEGADCEGNHFLLLEDGRLRALLLTQPRTCLLREDRGELRLRGIGIGTVCVDPSARNRGYMKLLMGRVQEEQAQGGYAFSVLSGDRHRYGHWGYEPAGTVFCGRISASVRRHALSRPDMERIREEITFERIRPGAESERLAYSIYNRQRLSVERDPHTFALRLSSNGNQGLLIRVRGIPTGYLCASYRRGETVLTELHLEEMEQDGYARMQGAVLKAFGERYAPEGYLLYTPSWDERALLLPQKVCEDISLAGDHLYAVSDLRAFLQFAMRAKAAVGFLADGELLFETGREWVLLSCHAGEVGVSVYQAAEGRPRGSGVLPLQCSRQEMIRLLFSPCLPTVSQQQRIPQGWLPLPLLLPQADAV